MRQPTDFQHNWAMHGVTDDSTNFPACFKSSNEPKFLRDELTDLRQIQADHRRITSSSALGYPSLL